MEPRCCRPSSASKLKSKRFNSKYKLSQNRPSADHGPVIDELEDRGAEALAAAMRKTLL